MWAVVPTRDHTDMYLYLHLELKYKHSIYAALLQVADAAGVEGLPITGKATRLQQTLNVPFLSFQAVLGFNFCPARMS